MEFIGDGQPGLEQLPEVGVPGLDELLVRLAPEQLSVPALSGLGQLVDITLPGLPHVEVFSVVLTGGDGVVDDDGGGDDDDDDDDS